MPGTRHPLTGEPWVRCARCDVGVQRMETFRDEQDQVFVLTVFCHGARETVRVPWQDMDGEDISLGDAFLEALPPKEPTRFLPAPVALRCKALGCVWPFWLYGRGYCEMHARAVQKEME